MASGTHYHLSHRSYKFINYVEPTIFTNAALEKKVEKYALDNFTEIKTVCVNYNINMGVKL